MSASDTAAEPGVIATATITIDRAYLGERYDDWVRHVSRFRKYELPVAIALTVLGAIVLVVNTRSLVGWGLLGCGVLDIAHSATHRWRFIRKVGTLLADGTRLDFRFAEDAIQIRTALSDSTVEWGYYRDFIVTPTGLFLGRKGSSIYVPDTILSPPGAKAEIVGRLRAATRGESGGSRQVNQARRPRHDV